MYVSISHCFSEYFLLFVTGTYVRTSTGICTFMKLFLGPDFYAIDSDKCRGAISGLPMKVRPKHLVSSANQVEVFVLISTVCLS